MCEINGIIYLNIQYNVTGERLKREYLYCIRDNSDTFAEQDIKTKNTIRFGQRIIAYTQI